MPIKNVPTPVVGQSQKPAGKEFVMSVGNVSSARNNKVNANGAIKIRGTGAATKGTMARGPMA